MNHQNNTELTTAMDQEFLIRLQSQNPHLDERDLAILCQRAHDFMASTRLIAGDFIDFPNSMTRRIALWFDETVQTSKGGSWYLGEGYAEFSGSLYQGIPISELTLTAENRLGKFWFFHHHHVQAHNGVYVNSPCRVWTTQIEAPSF